MGEVGTSWGGADELEIVVFKDAASIASHGANWLASALADLTGAGTAVLAVSGGRSPWAMFSELAARSDVRWDRVHIVQVDERIVPSGSDERNWTAVMRVFGPVVPSDNLHPMPVESGDVIAGAASYDELLHDLTNGRGPDLVHLGLGADGHTASLFPGDEATDTLDRGVVVTAKKHMGRRRMTMTLPMVSSSRHVLWQVQGLEKAEMLAHLVRGDESIPAGRVKRDGAIVLADAAAASLIS
jgi:6-phosphogluconolactonase